MLRLTKAILSAALFCGVVGSTSTIFADDAPAADAKPAHAASSRRALDRPLPEVRFNATPLSEVLDFLSDATNSNMSVDWKALDAAHIAKDAPVTLRMSAQVPLHKVLSMVLNQAAGTGILTFYVDEGVIEITTQEASDKVLYSRTYPIQDLLFQPTDAKSAPSLSLTNSSQGGGGSSGGGEGGGGGGGGSGASLFTGDTSSNSSTTVETPAVRAQEIIKLITDTVKPELWQANGGTATISFFRGNLIVNAPRSIHQLLESQ